MAESLFSQGNFELQSTSKIRRNCTPTVAYSCYIPALSILLAHRIAGHPYVLRAFPRTRRHNERSSRAFRALEGFQPRPITESIAGCSTAFNLQSAAAAIHASERVVAHLLASITHPQPNTFVEYHQPGEPIISYGDTSSRIGQNQQLAQLAEVQQSGWCINEPGRANGQSAECWEDTQWI